MMDYTAGQGRQAASEALSGLNQTPLPTLSEHGHMQQQEGGQGCISRQADLTFFFLNEISNS